MTTLESAQISTSESESDEIPKFDIPAFHKYTSKCLLSHENGKKFAQEKRPQFASKIGLGSDFSKGTYVDMDCKLESVQHQVTQQKERLKSELNKHLKRSVVCQPGFETMESLPCFQSRRQLKKMRLKERDKTKGFHWFNMVAPEMTEEKKNDLMVVQMRQALDPKHFYKRSSNKTNPKYFEVGTFVDSPLDFYSSRIPKKQRKQTLVDELLADAKFRSYQKKKMNEIIKMQPKKFMHRKKVKKNKVMEARYTDLKKKHKKNKK